jgi:hypothetical protein
VNLIGCGEWFGSSGLEIQATKKPLTHFCAGGQATSRAHRLSRPGHISLSSFTTLIHASVAFSTRFSGEIFRASCSKQIVKKIEAYVQI